MQRLATFIFAVASLALCLTCVGYWVASYARTGGGWHATYGDGNLCLYHLDPDTSGPYATEAFDKTPDHSGWWVWQNLVADGRMAAVHAAAGFRLRTGTIDRNDFHPERPLAPSPFLMVEVPFWSLTVATGVLPAVVYVKAKARRRRLARFACVECGYDMRGSPGRCPECGTASAIVHSSA